MSLADVKKHFEIAEATTKAKGTYAAVWLTKESALELFLFYKPYIKTLEQPEEFHITTTYSRVPIPELRNKHMNFFLAYENFSFDRFGDNKEYLVLKVKHANLNGLFNYAKSKGATFDYPSYEPHISLSTNFTGNVKELPLPDFDIFIDRYIVSELED